MLGDSHGPYLHSDHRVPLPEAPFYPIEQGRFYGGTPTRSYSLNDSKSSELQGQPNVSNTGNEPGGRGGIQKLSPSQTQWATRISNRDASSNPRNNSVGSSSSRSFSPGQRQLHAQSVTNSYELRHTTRRQQNPTDYLAGQTSANMFDQLHRGASPHRIQNEIWKAVQAQSLSETERLSLLSSFRKFSTSNTVSSMDLGASLSSNIYNSGLPATYELQFPSSARASSAGRVPRSVSATGVPVSAAPSYPHPGSRLKQSRQRGQGPPDQEVVVSPNRASSPGPARAPSPSRNYYDKDKVYATAAAARNSLAAAGRPPAHPHAQSVDFGSRARARSPGGSSSYLDLSRRSMTAGVDSVPPSLAATPGTPSGRMSDRYQRTDPSIPPSTRCVVVEKHTPGRLRSTSPTVNRQPPTYSSTVTHAATASDKHGLPPTAGVALSSRIARDKAASSPSRTSGAVQGRDELFRPSSPSHLLDRCRSSDVLESCSIEGHSSCALTVPTAPINRVRPAYQAPVPVPAPGRSESPVTSYCGDNGMPHHASSCLRGMSPGRPGPAIQIPLEAGGWGPADAAHDYRPPSSTARAVATASADSSSGLRRSSWGPECCSSPTLGDSSRLPDDAEFEFFEAVLRREPPPRRPSRVLSLSQSSMNLLSQQFQMLAARDREREAEGQGLQYPEILSSESPARIDRAPRPGRAVAAGGDGRGCGGRGGSVAGVPSARWQAVPDRVIPGGDEGSAGGALTLALGGSGGPSLLSSLASFADQLSSGDCSLDTIQGYASGYIDGRCQALPEFSQVRAQVVKEAVMKMVRMSYLRNSASAKSLASLATASPACPAIVGVPSSANGTEAVAVPSGSIARPGSAAAGPADGSAPGGCATSPPPGAGSCSKSGSPLSGPSHTDGVFFSLAPLAPPPSIQGRQISGGSNHHMNPTSIARAAAPEPAMESGKERDVDSPTGGEVPREGVVQRGVSFSPAVHPPSQPQFAATHRQGESRLANRLDGILPHAPAVESGGSGSLPVPVVQSVYTAPATGSPDPRPWESTLEGRCCSPQEADGSLSSPASSHRSSCGSKFQVFTAESARIPSPKHLATSVVVSGANNYTAALRKLESGSRRDAGIGEPRSRSTSRTRPPSLAAPKATSSATSGKGDGCRGGTEGGENNSSYSSGSSVASSVTPVPSSSAFPLPLSTWGTGPRELPCPSPFAFASDDQRLQPLSLSSSSSSSSSSPCCVASSLANGDAPSRGVSPVSTAPPFQDGSDQVRVEDAAGGIRDRVKSQEAFPTSSSTGVVCNGTSFCLSPWSTLPVPAPEGRATPPPPATSPAESWTTPGVGLRSSFAVNLLDSVESKDSINYSLPNRSPAMDLYVTAVRAAVAAPAITAETVGDPGSGRLDAPVRAPGNASTGPPVGQEISPFPHESKCNDVAAGPETRPAREPPSFSPTYAAAAGLKTIGLEPGTLADIVRVLLPKAPSASSMAGEGNLRKANAAQVPRGMDDEPPRESVALCDGFDVSGAGGRLGAAKLFRMAGNNGNGGVDGKMDSDAEDGRGGEGFGSCDEVEFYDMNSATSTPLWEVPLASPNDVEIQEKPVVDPIYSPPVANSVASSVTLAQEPSLECLAVGASAVPDPVLPSRWIGGRPLLSSPTQKLAPGDDSSFLRPAVSMSTEPSHGNVGNGEGEEEKAPPSPALNPIESIAPSAPSAHTIPLEPVVGLASSSRSSTSPTDVSSTQAARASVTSTSDNLDVAEPQGSVGSVSLPSNAPIPTSSNPPVSASISNNEETLEPAAAVPAKLAPVPRKRGVEPTLLEIRTLKAAISNGPATDEQLATMQELLDTLGRHRAALQRKHGEGHSVAKQLASLHTDMSKWLLVQKNGRTSRRPSTAGSPEAAQASSSSSSESKTNGTREANLDVAGKNVSDRGNISMGIAGDVKPTGRAGFSFPVVGGQNGAVTSRMPAPVPALPVYSASPDLMGAAPSSSVYGVSLKPEAQLSVAATAACAPLASPPPSHQQEQQQRQAFMAPAAASSLSPQQALNQLQRLQQLQQQKQQLERMKQQLLEQQQQQQAQQGAKSSPAGAFPFSQEISTQPFANAQESQQPNNPVFNNAKNSRFSPAAAYAVNGPQAQATMSYRGVSGSAMPMHPTSASGKQPSLLEMANQLNQQAMMNSRESSVRSSAADLAFITSGATPPLPPPPALRYDGAVKGSSHGSSGAVSDKPAAEGNVAKKSLTSKFGNLFSRK